MADQRNGGIAWCDESWNPTRGCSRVSKGCEHCYAETVARRFSGPGMPYEGLVRIGKDGAAKAQWNGAVRLVPEHLGDPLRWRRPRRVFVNSMSDLFHESLPFKAIAAVFGVMASAPRHTFQVLTKRPRRAREFMAWAADRDVGSIAAAMLGGAATKAGGAVYGFEAWTLRDPLPNVWLGVSVEDQATADERVPHLLCTPAAVRFVSYEPALGPVDWRDRWMRQTGCNDIGFCSGTCENGVDWIIVGGESGAGARPFDVAWARSTVEQCAAADVACFVKQLGARTVAQHPMGPPGALIDTTLLDRKGGDMDEWPEDLRVREFPP